MWYARLHKRIINCCAWKLGIWNLKKGKRNTEIISFYVAYSHVWAFSYQGNGRHKLDLPRALYILWLSCNLFEWINESRGISSLLVGREILLIEPIIYLNPIF